MALANTPPSKTSPRDLDQVDATAWPRREFPLSRDSTMKVPVVVRQSALNAIHRHGQETTDVEVCGVLVGNGYRDDNGPFVYVEGSIRGDHAANQLAQVTFTAETWRHIQEELDRSFPGHRIVGWYHTHPGFGIFLSPMDLFIHENFFDSPEQLALVYDPLGGDEGVFIWRQGHASREPVLVEADVCAESNLRISVSDLPNLIAAADASDLSQRIGRLERHQRNLWVGTASVLALALLWPIFLHWVWSPHGVLPEGGADDKHDQQAPDHVLPSYPHKRPPKKVPIDEPSLTPLRDRDVEPSPTLPQVPDAKQADPEGTEL